MRAFCYHGRSYACVCLLEGDTGNLPLSVCSRLAETPIERECVQAIEWQYFLKKWFFLLLFMTPSLFYTLFELMRAT